MHTAHCVVLTFRAKMEARVEKEEEGKGREGDEKGGEKESRPSGLCVSFVAGFRLQ